MKNYRSRIKRIENNFGGEAVILIMKATDESLEDAVIAFNNKSENKKCKKLSVAEVQGWCCFRNDYFYAYTKNCTFGDLWGSMDDIIAGNMTLFKVYTNFTSNK